MPVPTGSRSSTSTPSTKNYCHQRLYQYNPGAHHALAASRPTTPTFIPLDAPATIFVICYSNRRWCARRCCNTRRRTPVNWIGIVSARHSPAVGQVPTHPASAHSEFRHRSACRSRQIHIRSNTLKLLPCASAVLWVVDCASCLLRRLWAVGQCCEFCAAFHFVGFTLMLILTPCVHPTPLLNEAVHEEPCQLCSSASLLLTFPRGSLTRSSLTCYPDSRY